MSEVERKILRQFAVDLKRDVIPSDVLCHLLCLSEDDCEQIQREEDRKGPRAAVPMLLDRLKKRLHQGAFKQFSTALGETGSPHLKELLENALREQTCQAEPDHNPTQDTASNLKSDVFKTPTKETTNPLSPSTPETKQSKKSTNSKKSNKKLKLKNGRVPKENTTSPSESKTHTKLKTSDPLVSQDTTDPNPPYVKCVVKTTRDTKPKNQDVSQNAPRCPPVTRNNEDSQNEIPSSNSTETQPPATTNATEPDLPENSKTKYDTLVCYAKKNREVALELKQFLESEFGLQVCIDLEHFIPGKPTTDNISESINSSGSVIFLLSPEFLKKPWAPWELKHAVYDFIESQKDGTQKKIIPVLLEKCQVPEELKIYTAIEMEGSASRRDCWKKLAAAISGTSCSDDGDNSDGENGDGENGDGETNGDEDANNEGTIGVIDYNNGDDGVDKEGVEDTSDDENGDDSDDDLNQEGGEDTVNGSDEAESNDDDSTGSDNDHDGVDDGDEDDSENSTNDSDDGVNQNRDGNDTGADGNNSNEAGDSRCQDEVSDDVDDNGDGNSGGVGTSNNVVPVDANAGGSVNNLGNRGDDVYGKIQSL